MVKEELLLVEEELQWVEEELKWGVEKLHWVMGGGGAVMGGGGAVLYLRKLWVLWCCYINDTQHNSHTWDPHCGIPLGCFRNKDCCTKKKYCRSRDQALISVPYRIEAEQTNEVGAFSAIC